MQSEIEKCAPITPADEEISQEDLIYLDMPGLTTEIVDDLLAKRASAPRIKPKLVPAEAIQADEKKDFLIIDFRS
jgi:hypothetical protein